jgi:hypothetical protein
MRALAECQGKYAAFVSKRLAEDFAMPSRLAECRSPMEVIDVWAGFYRTAMEHYAGHARTMTELGQQALEDTVREAELEAATSWTPQPAPSRLLSQPETPPRSQIRRQPDPALNVRCHDI